MAGLGLSALDRTLRDRGAGGSGLDPSRSFLDLVREAHPGGASLLRLPPLSAAGAMAAGAAALTGWDQQRAGQAVSGAMARFGLDPSRPADVSAAQAYVKAGQYVPMNLA